MCAAEQPRAPPDRGLLHPPRDASRRGLVRGRFPTQGWVERLERVNKARRLKLAGHLCSKYVQQLLDGDTSHVASLVAQGFRRAAHAPPLLRAQHAHRQITAL